VKKNRNWDGTLRSGGGEVAWCVSVTRDGSRVDDSCALRFVGKRCDIGGVLAGFGCWEWIVGGGIEGRKGQRKDERGVDPFERGEIVLEGG
jgi:hypothetical protein